MSLPRGWVAATLADITVEKVDQGEPSKAEVDYIDIGSIDRDRKLIGPTEKVTAKTAPTRARQWVRQGDVLVSMTRPNLNAVALVPRSLDGSVASTGFDVLRSAGVVPELVFYRVRSHAFIQDVCKDVQGVVYPAIRPDDVRRHEMPIPPQEEQVRIVEAVDSYLSRLDDAIATLERVQAKLKTYRASVLKAAVEGRLVPTEAELARREKRSYEPAENLLKNILTERRRRWEEAELARLTSSGKAPSDNKWKVKYQEPATTSSPRPHLSEGWCLTSLSALLSEPLRNGHSARETAGENGVRTLTLSAVTVSDFGIHNTKVTSANREKVADLWLQPGDIFVERSNTPELVGTAAMYRGESNFAIFPDLLIRVRCTRSVLADYIELVLLALTSRHYFQKAAQGIAGSMPKISQRTIELLPVPLPPVREQQRIVEEAQRLLSVAAVVLGEINRNKAHCRALRQSILKAAFEGKLVDQDQADEPAGQLLGRIRRELIAVTPAARVRGTKAKAAS